MDYSDTAPRVSTQQLVARSKETLRVCREYERAARSELAQRFSFVDRYLVHNFPQVEKFNVCVSQKHGAISFLLRDRGYRRCASVWLGAIEELIAACRSGDSISDLVRLPALVTIGHMTVFVPACLITKQHWDLVHRIRAPPDMVAAQLEQQAARERRRRAVAIELLEPHTELDLELLEVRGQIDLIERALRENLADVRAGSVPHATHLDRFREAEVRMHQLQLAMRKLVQASGAFLGAFQEAADVRVHDLDGRAGESLRAQFATLQLKMEGMRSGYRSFLGRYRSLLETDADQGMAAAAPSPVPASGLEDLEGVQSATANSSVGVEPAALPATSQRPEPLDPLARASSCAAPRAPGSAKRSPSDRGANRSEAKKVGRQRVRNTKSSAAPAPLVARPPDAAARLRVTWGNAEDGLWYWVEDGVARRFGRETLDNIVATQFEKGGPVSRVPGHIRSPDVPNWVGGPLGHHTLPRSNLSLFFVRDGVQVRVVGVGAHAHGRKSHHKDYHVFWWREEKGRAVGPKRLSLV